ncbi:unnamed protein product [Peniophora sp. CBMAI 1063]|nr:unnamed protein product [Peniophora sp. CBMAI 1063]
MPPRELPGFYFDQAKNRYFPLSMRPKPAEVYPGASSVPANAPSTASSLRSVVPAKRSRPGSSSRADPAARQRSDEDAKDNASTRPIAATTSDRHHALRRTCSGPTMRREFHSMDMVHLAKTSACLTLCPAGSALGAPITALHAGLNTDTDRITLVTGDAGGFVNSTTVPAQQFIRPDTDAQNIQDAWTFECAMNLTAPILRVQGTGDRWMASSYHGEAFTMFIKTIQSDQGVMVAYNRLPDVWTSDLVDKRVCLGLHKRASIISDIERTDLALSHYTTGSDVLSVYQENHLLYTGLRSSSLLRFDLREPRLSKPPPPILTTSSSITTIKRVRQHELLVASMDGALTLYDTRFTSPHRQTEPVTSFRGHVNAYKHNLPVALTPSHDALFAAGLDGRLRGWSTRTGQAFSAGINTEDTPLFYTAPPKGSVSLYTRAHAIDVNPFETRFSEPLNALDVLEIEGRTYLLGAAGNRVLRWNLGHRPGFEY